LAPSLPAALDRFRRRPRIETVESFVRELASAFTGDRVTGRASEVAFWWAFTLLPALLVLAAVLGLLGQLVGESTGEQVEDAVVTAVVDFTGSDTNDAVIQVRDLFDQQAAGLLTLGVLLALWSTSRSFTALIYSLDEIDGRADDRGYVQIRAVGFGLAFFTIVAGAITLSMLVVGPLFGRGESVADGLGISPRLVSTTWLWLRVPFAVCVLVAFHATIFWLAPERRTSWRAGLPGAVSAAAAWVVASVGFSVYLGLTSGSSLVVGVLGTALTIMLWLYLLAIGLLLGAEVNAVLRDRRAGHASGGGR
jgi:membrane protein